MSLAEFIHSTVKNGKQITLLKNGFLKLGGTTDTNIYFVESGSLCVFVMDEDEEQIIRFGYNNDLIVSLDSFLTEQASDFYIQAIKKSKVRVIPKQQFIAFVNESNENQQMWISMLEDLVLQQIEREKDILTTSPKERYNRVLKRSPQLFQEIPNKYIANYLRMTPETLSRLKKS
ncbi:MAG: Crp/Fnr family transcriptional regulator [Flavobacteriales bacterium]|nr:Crp/Fnr family transcriptional regulator [Flavobacteriales bacterium]MCW8913403.1 Crp/Fnr family transcriptional regulator [Flavobacteriales bacterium]MCW8938533.1 Crp/Fnr family transcriptional regulator [Flavobacteriales bacterium]MCW8939484.1 Crp/Fnr family transcriptional regulator [Flavobacteriales bacterium]MCW8969480.1 Crp/Fnr family transcriptional regulator [Flavobacteriales bacterium]